MPPTNDVLFSSDLWKPALEKYALATNLTVQLYDIDGRVVFGPIHSTSLFQLFHDRNFDPGIFADCARRCLTQTAGQVTGQTTDRPAVTVCQYHGLAVVGTSLVLSGGVVGAAVGGYMLQDFSQVSEVQVLARHAGIAFERVWEVTRKQQPVAQSRLIVFGELLQVLGDALLRENYRTRQYQEAGAELQRVVADLEQFAYSASHDLQEPIRNVAIYSEILGARYGAALDAKGQQFLGFVNEGARRLEMLVKDLLVYTRATSGVDGEPVAIVDANIVFEQTLASLAEAIRESGATVTRDTLPQMRVHEVHLQQILQNLIGNAIKYRSQAPPRIHVSAINTGSQWRFSVTDNGIGIEPQYKERIFGIFKRLHTSKQYSGTGMGLAICKRLVERYQGRIWVESEPGKGATFFFTLPAAGKA